MHISRKNTIISVCGQREFSTQKLIHMVASGVKSRIKLGCEVGLSPFTYTLGNCLSLCNVYFTLHIF